MATIKLASGSDLPLLGLGTWKSSVGEVKKAVTVAIEVGYRHIDCAAAYANEKEIGEALKDVIERGIVKREDIFITSKIWNTFHKAELVKPALQKQLADLGLDYLDLYLIHWPMAFAAGDKLFPDDGKGGILFDNDTSYMETYKAMETLVDEGLVKNIGVSNFNSVQIKDVLESSRIKPAVHQFEIHPFFQQEKLVDYCKQSGIEVAGYSNFGSPDRPWKDDRPRSVLEDSVLIGIGQKYKKSAAQVVLRWLIQRKIVAIPKSVTPERITQNFDVFDFELSADDMNLIKTVDKHQRVIDPISIVDGVRVSKFASAKCYPFAIEY